MPQPTSEPAPYILDMHNLGVRSGAGQPWQSWVLNPPPTTSTSNTYLLLEFCLLGVALEGAAEGDLFDRGHLPPFGHGLQRLLEPQVVIVQLLAPSLELEDRVLCHVKLLLEICPVCESVRACVSLGVTHVCSMALYLV